MELQMFVLFFSLFSYWVSSQIINEPYIAPSSSLWSRYYNMIGGTNGVMNFSTHFQFELFGFVGWEAQPIERDPTFFNRSYSSSTVYQDFEFLFGVVPGLEIKYLAKFPEHDLFDGPGPVQRIGHTGTWYDHNLILFGGYDQTTGTFLNDLWLADLRAESLGWELLTADSPIPPRAYHTAVLYEDSIYIYGGTNGTTIFGDIWRYDMIPGCWSKVYQLTYSPQPRAGHSAVYWATEAMYVWGGFNALGLINDMWKFKFQEEQWEPVAQGQILPSPRAFFGYAVIDDQFLVFGGQVGNTQAPTIYWSPDIFLASKNNSANCTIPSGFITIPNPSELSGEVWSYNFFLHNWTRIGCMPPFNASSPNGCRSFNHVQCPNNCSGNGVCINGTCICRTNWNGIDCSNSTCQTYRGYDFELVERVVLAEAILNLGRSLMRLRTELLSIGERLPPFSELTSCSALNTQLNADLIALASKLGLEFEEDCLSDEFLPLLQELNQVLELTNKNAMSN